MKRTEPGTVHFHVSVKVDMATLAGWKPEVVAAFFEGIGRVLSAEAAVTAGEDAEASPGVEFGKPE